METVYTIDCISGKEILTVNSTKCLTDIVGKYFIFGYTCEPCETIKIYNGFWVETYIPFGKFSDHKVYHRAWSTYFLDFNVPLDQLIAAQYSKGNGFPYTFSKRYEAVENFDIFKNKQKILSNDFFELSKYLKYSFGLEYETSCGIIPEDICFRDGLIPLRDGSISGNEYSTVVLRGNEGLNLLYQQLKTLREYTRFDKECSLHIHMGGFPLVSDRILSLYNLCVKLQEELRRSLPQFTFNTAKYKSSGKDYCKMLERCYLTFDDLYSFLTGVSFFGDLNQAHPNDVDRSRKWQIHQRYYWANILNLICYRVNKTMEFRMLRPTYNLHKILFWIYIFNAILIYAENKDITPQSHIKIEEVLTFVYPADLTKKLMIDFYKCQVCSDEQAHCGDYIGARIDIEDEFFDKDDMI